jgi:DNA-binding response OmpR family regulator
MGEGMRRVWVIEDDEPIARCLEMLLRESGYVVEVAGSLATARALGPEPDLVLLDYLLPDGNGITFLPELARAHPGVPVILLTALERVGASAFPAHVTFLSKPFRNRDLLALVDAKFRSGGAVA